MNKIEYKSEQRRSIEGRKVDEHKLQLGSDKIELHHSIGRGNSEETIPICSACHNFITQQLNSLSVKDRKNLLLKARISARAMIELGTKWLRIIDEAEIENAK